MNFLPEAIEQYVEKHSEKEPVLLQQLNRETWQKVLNPRMLSGAFQGRVLAMISKLVNPSKVLEIGTYTGYSALCLAEGMKSGGQLITIDINEELEAFARAYFDRSEFGSMIEQRIGNALEIIPDLDQQFDLVFIDADKSNYCNYYNRIKDKLNPGGIILSDNVLWSGKVIEPIEKDDIDTQGLVAYNKLLHEDPKLETVLLPIRDGLTISRYKGK
jgi:predicted O-methyltransferase YrrM